MESGKRHTNRPQLQEALAQCRKHKAVLVIAKLYRLARNVHFISGLMESGVDFTACDMPSANRLTIHILAAVAEHEREMISKRTQRGPCGREGKRHQAWNPTPGSIHSGEMPGSEAQGAFTEARRFPALALGPQGSEVHLSSHCRRDEPPRREADRPRAPVVCLDRPVSPEATRASGKTAGSGIERIRPRCA